MLCLPPGATQTLVWSVYPVATPSYWDFINRVRADWHVDRTVPGSFIWFTPDAILATPPERLRDALARQRTAIAAMFGGWIDPLRKERPPFIGFGTAVLGDAFSAYRERLRSAVQRLKDARTDLRVLLYFDVQRDSSPDALSRFTDSVLLDADQKPERADWGGEFSPSWGMVPTIDNGFGRALPEVVRSMRDLGADGLYWDEMDGVDYRVPRVTTSAWDGHSCTLGDDGAVEAKLGLVNLLSDTAKLASAAAAGFVLGNVPPTTRAFTERADLRMVEAEDFEPYGPMAHLTTPLAYVGNRRDFAIVRAKIDEGLLVAGARFDVDHEIVGSDVSLHARVSAARHAPRPRAHHHDRERHPRLAPLRRRGAGVSLRRRRPRARRRLACETPARWRLPARWAASGRGRGRRMRSVARLARPLRRAAAHELGHGGVSARRDPVAARERHERAPEDPKVEPEAPVVDVPDVERELFLPREPVPSAHLGQAGQAGRDLVAARLLGGVALEVLRQQRARTDQRHVAAQHVPELRQLVEAGGAEPAADGRQARVVARPRPRASCGA